MTEKENPCDVNIGDIWVDNDPRYHGERKFKIIDFGTSKDGLPVVQIESFLTGRKTWSRTDRFNGRRSNGYSLETGGGCKND
jgi:hypothetical protein